MTANVSDVLVVVVCFLMLQNLLPSVITRSLESRERFTSNNMQVTYWSVDFTFSNIHIFLADKIRQFGRFSANKNLAANSAIGSCLGSSCNMVVVYLTHSLCRMSCCLVHVTDANRSMVRHRNGSCGQVAVWICSNIHICLPLEILHRLAAVVFRWDT